MGAGSSAEKVSNSNPALDSLQAQSRAKNDPQVQALLQKVSSGQMSFKDAMAASQNFTGTADPNAAKRADLQAQLAQAKQMGPNQLGMAGGGGFQQNSANADWQGNINNLQKQLADLPDLSNNSQNLGQAFSSAAYTDPSTGSMIASDFVRNDPLTSGLFGKGGIQDQSQAQYGVLNNNFQSGLSNLAQDREALMGRDQSYGLQDSDLAAYGQASGNVGRLFANSEQSLAQSLADRGMASGSNGAAAAGFAGLQGNKLEQLAGLQQTISQNRINTAQSLAQARTNADISQQSQIQQAQAANNALMGGLGNLSQTAISNQYGRQLAGDENNYNQQAGAAGLAMSNQGLQQGVANSQFAQQQATSGPSLGSILGGIVGGVGSAVGSTLGTNLGDKIVKPTV